LEEETKRSSEESEEKEEATQPQAESPSEVKEKTEALLQDLLEEESSQTGPKVQKKGKGPILILLGFFLILLLLALAFFVLYKIFQKKESPVDSSQGEQRVVKIQEPTEAREKPKEPVKEVNATAFKAPSEKRYAYRLDLKNFLVPLNEQTFLKMDVFLYFERAEDYKKAQVNSLSIRHFIYDEVKRENLLLWRDEKRLKEVEEGLRNKMQTGPLMLKTDKVELEGTLLRV
jgi:hypothetical protein